MRIPPKKVLLRSALAIATILVPMPVNTGEDQIVAARAAAHAAAAATSAASAALPAAAENMVDD